MDKAGELKSQIGHPDVTIENASEILADLQLSCQQVSADLLDLQCTCPAG